MSFGNSIGVSDCSPSLEAQLATEYKCKEANKTLITAIQKIAEIHGVHSLYDLKIHHAIGCLTVSIDQNKQEIKRLKNLLKNKKK